MTSAAKLDSLAARFWDFISEEVPFNAFLAGEAGDAVTLFRESPADHDRRAARARAFLTELDDLDLDALEGQPRATGELLRFELGNIIEAHSLMSHLRPSLLPVGPEFNTVFLAQQAHIADPSAAELWVKRVAALPAFLDDIAACLKEGLARGIRFPRAVIEPAVANVRRTAALDPDASPWLAVFERSPVRDEPAVRTARERARTIVAERLQPAFERYAALIEGPIATAARETISCTDAPAGEAFYDFWVRRFTTTGMTAREVHDFGVAEVARLEAEAEAIAADAGYDDARAYRAHLVSDTTFILADANALRERAEIVCKRIDARIPNFFGRIPRVTYGVESMSAAMSVSMPPAYAQPSPSGGSVAGKFWITGLPERLPTYFLPAFAIHEAWPGHLMHIGLMAELDELPAFRRHGAVNYTACIEGWALYCEQLGHEFGIYTTSAELYGRLEGELWRACRLVVDTGIHALGWTRGAAIDYLAARLTLPRATIEQEVDRYIALPGQALAYQIGGAKILSLRRRAEARLGSRFAHRAFHDTVTTAGAVTLPVLERLVEAWLETA
ncbi:DUF885 family protein [Novosphingobium sp. Gsoil 351]|uniref:DUF885 domain-containing protein n=1 Tax=Novosphingobium sp. Gsoil 351 TaxID=2675225 RepID=UPI0018A80AE2|nr:DUF885 domain-containing protein [Novosphingobium sp. Gsoil 351]